MQAASLNYMRYIAPRSSGGASLQYSANAVAEVVSFKSEPHAEDGAVQGSVLHAGISNE